MSQPRQEPLRLAAILCLVPALYFLGIAGYALVHFSSYSSDWPRLLRYVLGPGLIGASLALAAFRSPGEWRLITGICATSVLVGLFLFEAYLTFSTLSAAMGVIGKTDREVDKSEYVQNLPPAYTLKKVNIQLGITDLRDAYLTALPGKDVLLCAQNGLPVTYRPDQYGFRNPEHLGGGNADVLLLGDSFAEGICLGDGEDLASKLREEFPTLVNTGTRGAGPLFELAVLGRYGPVFRPKVTVMVFFAGNDWENLAKEASLPWLKTALDPEVDFGPTTVSDARESQFLALVGQWWETQSFSLKDFMRSHKVVRNFLALQKTALVLGLHYPKASQPNPVYTEILKRATETVAQWDGDIVVVYLPTIDLFRGIFRHDFVHDELRSMVKEAAADAGVQVIDLTEHFKAVERPRSLYAPDAHLSPAGAATAADVIARKIRNDFLTE